MNAEPIRTLVRDLQFIVKMIALSVDKGDVQSVIRYTNSAGNILNKISQNTLLSR